MPRGKNVKRIKLTFVRDLYSCIHRICFSSPDLSRLGKYVYSVLSVMEERRRALFPIDLIEFSNLPIESGDLGQFVNITDMSLHVLN